MRYYVTKVKENLFNVVEKETGIVVYSYSEYKPARIHALDLESGYAFDGWTPPFFVKNTNQRANAEIKQFATEKVA